MIIAILITVLTAYLLGSIPTSVWIGRLFFGVDVREKGSGNAGATNTIRVLGWKAGIPVLIFDALKGWLAVNLTMFYGFDFLNPSQTIYLRIGLACAAVLGHIFPAYIGFRGGKGVATLLGVGIALYPVSVWIVVGVFIVVLLISRIVSVSSVIASMSFPFIVIFIFQCENPGLMLLSVAVGVFVPLTHLSNMKRLLRGGEKRFSFKRKENKNPDG